MCYWRRFVILSTRTCFWNVYELIVSAVKITFRRTAFGVIRHLSIDNSVMAVFSCHTIMITISCSGSYGFITSSRWFWSRLESDNGETLNNMVYTVYTDLIYTSNNLHDIFEYRFSWSGRRSVHPKRSLTTSRRIIFRFHGAEWRDNRI